MDVSNSVLMQLPLICKDSNCTTILIRKLINVSNLKLLESRLAGCYQHIRDSTTQKEKDTHLVNRKYIEDQLEYFNAQSVEIDLDLDPFLESLPKESRKVYEHLMQDFKEGKY